MKAEVVEKVKDRLPEIGECWQHDGYPEVYMRIDNKQGKRAIGFAYNGYFYSVMMQDAAIYATPVSSLNIIIIEPVVGVLKNAKKGDHGMSEKTIDVFIEQPASKVAYFSGFIGKTDFCSKLYSSRRAAIRGAERFCQKIGFECRIKGDK